MLDEDEFLSQYGIRAISRFHKARSYMLQVNGTQHSVDYEPAESSIGLAAIQTGVAQFGFA
jgi:hypothetical protein